MSQILSNNSDNTFRPVAIALIIAGLAGGVGFAVAKKGAQSYGQAGAIPVASSSVASEAPLTPESVRAGVPALENKTAVEREVTKRLNLTQTRSQDPQVWTNLGDALMQLFRERADTHNVGPAENAYRYALSLKPENADALTGMAWVTGNRHQFEQSMDWAKKAIAVRPDVSAAYGLMGDAQVERGDYDGAFDTYQKMLDIRPDLSSYSRGAHLLYITGDLHKAIWLMTKAVNSGGPYAENTAWCRAQLAEMLFATGGVLPAESQVKEGMKTAPMNPFLLVMDAKIKLAKKDLPGAIASAEKVATTAPQHVAGLILLYDLYLKNHDRAKADAIRTQVETAAVHYKMHGNADQLFLAKFYADHDIRLADALTIVDEKTDKGTKEMSAPNDADVAAWVYFKNGKQELADKYSREARHKGAEDATRLYHGGMIAAKGGDSQEARLMLYKAMSINSHFDPLQADIAAKTLTDLGAKQISVAVTGKANTR